MHFFLVAAVPIALVLGLYTVLFYLQLKRPSPKALGCAFSKFCVVSADEIKSYYEADENEDFADHLRREFASQQLRVSRRFVGLMASNTKLIQQVIRFEKLKINPHKSSLDYETRETLTLRLVDEASAVRWFLLKGQATLALRSCLGIRIGRQAMRNMLAEYKQLEQDFLALVRMGADEVYYTMLVERLGLSNWRLFDGSSTPAAS